MSLFLQLCWAIFSSLAKQPALSETTKRYHKIMTQSLLGQVPHFLMFKTSKSPLS